jgi:hypothetical protein
MIPKIVGAAFLIVLGGLAGFLLASNPQVAAYLHWQQPMAEATKLQSRVDPDMELRLQERCADRAKKFYEEEYAQLEQELSLRKKQTDPTVFTVYESHYNLRLNKCFILATTKVFPHDGKEKTTYALHVQDVNTRQQYAYYSRTECEVRGTTCNSESEWWHLVKPYIEELASF